MVNKIKYNKLGWLVLFTTTSTLLCCALPILLVSLGMGAAMAAVASNAPWLVWLTMHKLWIFIVSGLVLALALWSVFRPGRSCPIDKELGKYCSAANKVNKMMLFISIFLWFVGLFTAYVLPVFV
ncbi:MAG: hypothetical protein OIF36_03935 [Alphaproteobacteria bacterium]|nr:hypothetical protein [Alphaproteobacteria bacterium]